MSKTKTATSPPHEGESVGTRNTEGETDRQTGRQVNDQMLVSGICTVKKHPKTFDLNRNLFTHLHVFTYTQTRK